MVETLSERVLGRVVIGDVITVDATEVIVPDGEMLDEHYVALLEKIVSIMYMCVLLLPVKTDMEYVPSVMVVI